MRHLSFVSALFTIVSPVFAADVAVSSKIDEVTIYPDGASVSRVIEFDVAKGENTLIAKDFPLGLEPSSLRVKGATENGSIQIGSVDAKIVLVEAKKPDAELAAKLEALNDQKMAVQSEQAALSTKKSMIERVARSAELSSSRDGDKQIDPNALRSAWNAVGEDLAQINEAIRQQNVKLRAIDKEIAKLTAARDAPLSTDQRQMEVKVALSADQAAKGKVTVSYKVDQARWTALYDARLDTDKGALEIVRRAEISQQTGEDWTEAALTVSTALANAGAQAPRLGAMILAFDENFNDENSSGGFAPPARAQPSVSSSSEVKTFRREESRLGLANQESAAEAQKLDGDEQLAKKPIVQSQATLDTGGYQSSWKVPGRISIASGPAKRLLRLSSSTVQPRIVARAVPAIEQTAFLEAVFDHEEDAPFFPGRVSIYRDGLYTGEVLMPLATKSEPVRLGFGADDRIRVERVPTRKIENDSTRYLRSSRSEFKISLRNGRPTPISVTVEEATPVTENTDIKVEMLPVTTPGATKNDDDRRGVMTWTVDLEPGATKDIRVGYKVVWPANRTISRTSAPNF